MKLIFMKTNRLGVAPKILAICISLVLAVPASPVHADKKQKKYYKRAFKEKPKCIYCHVDAKPKKDDGMHDLNDYGKQAMDITEKPKKETYLQLGPVDPAQYADVEDGEEESDDDESEGE
jgi:hypothetical protein